MSLRVQRYETTPNPNALKCVLSGTVSQATLSFLNADDAGEHPIAKRLFASGMVRAILMNADWMTVNKLPDADWKTLKPIVEQTLADAPAHDD